MTEVLNVSGSWFALYVKPRHERAIAEALRAKGFEQFLPLYKARRRWSDRVKELEAPLFPRYVFCRFGALDHLRVVTTPGVWCVVGTGKRPVSIPESEMAALQTVVRSGLCAHPWPFLRAGQMVRIDAGPLRGLEGILAASRNAQRLVISVTLLQRSVAVEVDRLYVTPIGAPGVCPSHNLGRGAGASSVACCQF